MTQLEEKTLWKSLESMADRDLREWEREHERERDELLRAMWKDREYQRLREKVEAYEEEYDGALPIKLDERILLMLRRYNIIQYPELEISDLIQLILDQHFRFVENFTPGFIYQEGN